MEQKKMYCSPGMNATPKTHADLYKDGDQTLSHSFFFLLRWYIFTAKTIKGPLPFSNNCPDVMYTFVVVVYDVITSWVACRYFYPLRRSYCCKYYVGALI